MSIGIYFSANDDVIAWTLPFLTSLRTYNPDIELCLIPFDANCQETKALSKRFHFEVYEDESFAALEAIGSNLELGHSAYGPYWFRRYAAFWGPFERFLYLDARQVVLADLMPFVMSTQTFELDFVYYDTALDQVYEQGQMRLDFLRQGGARGFNSGRWASRKGLFRIEDFEVLGDAQVAVREQLNQRNTDQAFINYCCDSRKVSMAKISDLLGNTVSCGWARQPGQPYLDSSGVWRLWEHGGNDHKKQLLLLHWAGYTQGDRLPNVWLSKRFGGRLSMKPGRVLRKLLAASRTIRWLAGRLV